MTNLINNYSHHTITVEGVVTNTKTTNVKSQWIGSNGYKHVDIQEFGKATKVTVHRLLALQFLPNPENKRTVNHIDGDKQNNCLTNLEWATDSENIQHAYDTGLNRQQKKITSVDYSSILTRFFAGETLTTIVKDYPFSLPTFSTYVESYVIATAKQIEYVTEKCRQKAERNRTAKRVTFPVVRIDKLDPTIRVTYTSLREASRALGKSSSGPISNVLAGRAKSAYGYFWERV